MCVAGSYVHRGFELAVGVDVARVPVEGLRAPSGDHIAGGHIVEGVALRHDAGRDAFAAVEGLGDGDADDDACGEGEEGTDHGEEVF